MNLGFRLSFGVSMLLIFLSCSNHIDQDNCPKISSLYADELVGKLKKNTENMRYDLQYVYSQFDVVQAKIVAGSRELKDSIYINKAIFLKNESFSIMESVSLCLEYDSYNGQKLKDVQSHYESVIYEILDNVGDAEILSDCIQDIDTRFSELKELDFDQFDKYEMAIERELYLQKIMGIESITAEHILWVIR